MKEIEGGGWEGVQEFNENARKLRFGSVRIICNELCTIERVCVYVFVWH